MRPLYIVVGATASLITIARTDPIAGPNPQWGGGRPGCRSASAILGGLNPQPITGDASVFCSSYIGETDSGTTTKTITTVAGHTAFITAPVTTVVTTTAVAAAPTVTQVVYSNCGIPGYAGATSAYFYDDSGAYGNFTGCSGRCKADAANCASFAYGSGQCLLFNATVPGNVNPSASSPFTFFDRNCPAASVPNTGSKTVDGKRQIIISIPIIIPGLPTHTPPKWTTRRPWPTPTRTWGGDGEDGSDTSLVSSLCTCLITSAPTSYAATHTTTTTVTSSGLLITVVTSVPVATITRTISGGTASPVTLTITTSA